MSKNTCERSPTLRLRVRLRASVERGATLVEMALLVALVAVITISAVRKLGYKTKGDALLTACLLDPYGFCVGGWGANCNNPGWCEDGSICYWAYGKVGRDSGGVNWGSSIGNCFPGAVLDATNCARVPASFK